MKNTQIKSETYDSINYLTNLVLYFIKKGKKEQVERIVLKSLLDFHKKKTSKKYIWKDINTCFINNISEVKVWEIKKRQFVIKKYIPAAYEYKITKAFLYIKKNLNTKERLYKNFVFNLIDLGITKNNIKNKVYTQIVSVKTTD